MDSNIFKVLTWTLVGTWHWLALTIILERSMASHPLTNENIEANGGQVGGAG